ncbi:alpha-mannosidase [Microbacterium sp. TWP3-1-2b2]|uniref:alpha-mannosidase n=1 Tax=Microbacterium sp. TWP3-1-2b2 TaxID=2804651 RepID=UPI003CEA6673
MNSSPDPIKTRLDRFVRERLLSAVEHASADVTVEAWDVPGEPVPFSEAVRQRFEPFAVGRSWGRPWGTTWFRVTGTVPADWSVGTDGIELVIDPGFIHDWAGFQVEALVYDREGRILKGIEPRNDYVRLGLAPGESFEVFVEAAANPDVIGEMTFAPTALGRRETAPREHLYTLRRVALVHRDPEVWELMQDIWTLEGLAEQLPDPSPRRAAVWGALDAVVDAVDPADVHGTASDGRAALAAVLSSPAAASAHRIFAVGHAHIDSAWLWPVRETVRKCARTFSNVLDLMDQHPDFIFACSSAQQYAWVKEFYPELYERIKVRVAEGRFVPVGGMWVESDTNLPGAEALARQFVEGKRFFLEEFGIDTTEVWLPDSFGYTAALPQIAAAAGAGYFLTQKLSWNEVNAFPHHSFEWEGIDGTRIFTHFPPVDTYNSMLSGAELAHTERNLAGKGRANTSLVPFGYGDGGGGPTREMMAAVERTRSLEGSPTVRVTTPAVFFEEASAELQSRPVWVGELYLESHRGTYSAQARTKRGNRRSESLLHEAELWATTASVRLGAPYPTEVLRKAWRTVLLQQFHDILPGSSIGWVYDQAEVEYAQIKEALEGVIGEALSALAEGAQEPLFANSAPVTIDGVPPFAIGTRDVGGDVHVSEADGSITLSNGLVSVVVDADGLLVSLVDAASRREAIAPGARGGLLQVFRDTPRKFDAWDVDIEYRRSVVDLVTADSLEIEHGDESATVRVTRSFGASTVEQCITVTAGIAAVDLETNVDWHEQQKMLKLGVPVDVHTTTARSEIQFGHIERPIHTNTSWDVARFETAAQRWVHVGDAEFGFGVANDAIYGHDVTRHERTGGGTFALVRQTLVRAPLFPDPVADQGHHSFRTSFVPGGVSAAIEAGYRLNLPLREAAAAVAPLVVAGDGALIETVKSAEDGSGDVIVRLYEPLGVRARVDLTVGFAVRAIEQTDLIERPAEGHAIVRTEEGTVELQLSPFEIVTLRFVTV